MKGKYNEGCSNYCSARNNLVSEARCNSIEEYLKITKMDKSGSWGTDKEIFLAALILKTDVFVYKDDDQCWMKFSGYGFTGKNSRPELTEDRVYLRLYLDHFQPVTKVKDRNNMQTK